MWTKTLIPVNQKEGDSKKEEKFSNSVDKKKAYEKSDDSSII